MLEYSLVLTDHELNTLQDILEDVLKDTELELRRTEAFHAKEVVRSKERRSSLSSQVTRGACRRGLPK